MKKNDVSEYLIEGSNYWTLPGLISGISLIGGKSTPESIVNAVVLKLGVSEIALRGHNRMRRIIEARQIAMWLIRSYTTLSLASIGVIFQKDHTSVIHSCNRINDLIETDDIIQEKIDSVISIL